MREDGKLTLARLRTVWPPDVLVLSEPRCRKGGELVLEQAPRRSAGPYVALRTAGLGYARITSTLR